MRLVQLLATQKDNTFETSVNGKGTVALFGSAAWKDGILLS